MIRAHVRKHGSGYGIWYYTPRTTVGRSFLWRKPDEFYYSIEYAFERASLRVVALRHLETCNNEIERLRRLEAEEK